MPTNKADECVTVRLPAGVKDQLRAATGQPISRLFRTLGMAMLEQIKAERKPSPLEQARELVADAMDSHKLKG